jgi:hypothetical protein
MAAALFDTAQSPRSWLKRRLALKIVDTLHADGGYPCLSGVRHEIIKDRSKPLIGDHQRGRIGRTGHSA